MVQLNISNSQLIIQKIFVQFKSEMDWIYNAIMELLTDVLKRIVNEELNDVLLDSMLELGNYGLGTMMTISGESPVAMATTRAPVTRPKESVTPTSAGGKST